MASDPLLFGRTRSCSQVFRAGIGDPGLVYVVLRGSMLVSDWLEYGQSNSIHQPVWSQKGLYLRFSYPFKQI
jgi:hypothetical protein